ncbi:MAG: DoxX family protein [Rhizobiaceae bacterium]
MNSLALLIARILLVVLFVITGLGFISTSDGIAQYFTILNLPAPEILVWLVVALKLGASVLILIGLFTRWAALAMAAFCIAAPLIAHMNWEDANEFQQFLKDIAIAGGFLALSVAGAGAISVDAARGRA